MTRRVLHVLTVALLIALWPSQEIAVVAPYYIAESAPPTQPDPPAFEQEEYTPRTYPEFELSSPVDIVPEPKLNPRQFGQPTKLLSEALDIRASMYVHDLDRDGMIVYPIPGMIAIYQGWKFHENSPIMIAGHVTDVFSRATELELGDQLTLTFENGDVLNYEVVETSRTFDQEGSKNIDYTGIAESSESNKLYLITCGRASDGDEIRPDGTSAVNKLVVFKAIS